MHVSIRFIGAIPFLCRWQRTGFTAETEHKLMSCSELLLVFKRVVVFWLLAGGLHKTPPNPRVFEGIKHASKSLPAVKSESYSSGKIF